MVRNIARAASVFAVLFLCNHALAAVKCTGGKRNPNNNQAVQWWGTYANIPGIVVGVQGKWTPSGQNGWSNFINGIAANGSWDVPGNGGFVIVGNGAVDVRGWITNNAGTLFPSDQQTIQ